MANRKKNTTGKESTKKIFRADIEERLIQVLTEIKDAVGEKKFERRIKRAGKLLTRGIHRKAIENVQKKLPSTPEQPVHSEGTSSSIQDLP